MTNGWTEEVMHFWFEELRPTAWFCNDEHVDPHRNAVLGRTSTAAEILFLETHRGF